MIESEAVCAGGGSTPSDRSIGSSWAGRRPESSDALLPISVCIDQLNIYLQQFYAEQAKLARDAHDELTSFMVADDQSSGGLR
jgi:hypothetical protein